MQLWALTAFMLMSTASMTGPILVWRVSLLSCAMSLCSARQLMWCSPTSLLYAFSSSLTVVCERPEYCSKKQSFPTIEDSHATEGCRPCDEQAAYGRQRRKPLRACLRICRPSHVGPICAAAAQQSLQAPPPSQNDRVGLSVCGALPHLRCYCRYTAAFSHACSGWSRASGNYLPAAS